jgi:RNA polymerase sigma factor (sigma-70 family)
MRKETDGPVLQELLRWLDGRSADSLSDAELLDRFVAGRDEAAFAALVRRHGPMVFGVCRRLLRQTQDAEDAFQATFLVLADRGATIRKRESLASWLYGVARRLANRARGDAGSRVPEEAASAAPGPAEDAAARELQALLDEELGRLPRNYRLALLLCGLCGRTHQEAAREIGCPPGSVSGHLARGREMLRDRLARRGVALPAAALVVVFERMVHAVPPALSQATAAAAGRAARDFFSPRVIALKEGLVRAMIAAKWRGGLLVGLTLTCLLAGGVAWRAVAGGTRAADDPPGPEQTAPEPAARPGPRAEEPAPKPADKPKADKAPYGKVVVEVLVDDMGPRDKPLVLSVEEPEWIVKLAALFPEMGQGKKGRPPGEWKASVLVTFHPARGKPIHVSVHHDYAYWSEGDGDWDLARGARKTLAELTNVADQTRLEGKWQAVLIEKDGKKRTEKELRDMRWVIDHGTARYEDGGKAVRRVLLVEDAAARPPKMTLTLNDLSRTFQAIYQLDGDTLKICENVSSPKGRPTEFTAGEGSGHILYVLKRVPVKP